LQLSSLPGLYFFIANPNVGVKDYFGAFDLAVLMKKLGEALQTMLPGRKLAVTAISKWGGGRLEPHEGHQNGTDIDIRYLTNNELIPAQVITRGRTNSSFLVSQQWKLLKKAYQTNMVEVFFVDPVIKKAMCEEARRVHDYKNGDDDSEGAEVLRRLQTWPGHDTHFHIRIRCGSDNPGCKPAPISSKQVGC
jgi:penicillin-insensitive murein endopeptidase